MANTNTILNNLLSEALPIVENWLRGIVADEIRRTLEEEQKKSRPERYLSRDEVCQLIGISKPTLWKKTKDGEIKATTVGRRVTYAESEVKRFMEGTNHE